MQFDLDVAIDVCRRASIEDALNLAKRNFKYDSCITILIEDMSRYDEALDYIWYVPTVPNFEIHSFNLDRLLLVIQPYHFNGLSIF